ncbi:MAG: hypothetical protein K8R36_17230 [Planctomycetales bacterium]|nr:hypothetical protein [Planctomycetales bacterium]
MNLLTYTYLAYLALSAVVTIWVAQTLHFRGRLFLVKNFHGDELLADSVNHLLVVGFYLLNFGYVALALKYGEKPTDLQTAVEFLATKLGLVLVILGAMHFFNLYVFSRIGRQKAVPPVRGAGLFGPASGPQAGGQYPPGQSPFAPTNYQQLRGAVLNAVQNRNA